MTRIADADIRVVSMIDFVDEVCEYLLTQEQTQTTDVERNELMVVRETPMTDSGVFVRLTGIVAREREDKKYGTFCAQLLHKDGSGPNPFVLKAIESIVGTFQMGFRVYGVHQAAELSPSCLADYIADGLRVCNKFLLRMAAERATVEKLFQVHKTRLEMLDLQKASLIADFDKEVSNILKQAESKWAAR